MKQVLNEFMQLGFKQEEAFKILQLRKKFQAFCKTDIAKRFETLCKFFKKFNKTPSEVRKKIVQSPKLFDYLPEFIEHNLKNAALLFNCSQKEVFYHFWDTPLLFTISPSVMKRNLQAQADVLKIPLDVWKKIALKKPPVLKKNAQMLKSSIQLMASELKISQDEWVKITLKASELLCADPNTLLKKTKENASVLGTDISSVVKSFSRFPSLFYIDPKKLQAKYDFIKQMYMDDLICLDDNGKKNEKVLTKYLLNKPLILVYSMEAFELKKVYAEYIKIQKGKPQKGPLYRTERDILSQLEKAPDSFWTVQSYKIYQKRLNAQRKEQNERT